MPYVYFLKNEKGNYYIGSTTNITERLKHHLGGHTPSTKRLKVKELIFYQEYNTLAEARTIESKLKSFKRKDFIEKIIKEGKIRIKPNLPR